MDNSIPRGAESARGGGPEVDIGLFSLAQQLIQRVRFTQDERVVVETGDIASDVHTARKEFEMGHIHQSLQAVARCCAGFDQMVAQWESRARRKEAQKQKLSMQQIRKMHAEHSGVRTRAELARTHLRRLRVGLDQLEKLSHSRPAAATAEGLTAPQQPPDR